MFLSKSGQSDQMTMPARRASKFSAKWRAIKLQTIFQSLNSQAILGFCEPWSECQPEESRNDADGGEPTSAVPHSHRQATAHRDQISRSATKHAPGCLEYVLWILSLFADLWVLPSTPWSMILPQALFFLKSKNQDLGSMYLVDVAYVYRF